MKHICYIGDSAYESFLEAKKMKIWAGNKRNNFEIMKKGDIIYFFVKIKVLENFWKPGFPRVKNINELNGYFEEIVKVELISNPKEVSTPKFGTKYPIEINFKMTSQTENLETKDIDPIVLETIRKAIIAKQIKSFESEWDI